MVKGCCVHGCTANSSSNSDRDFFIIPKESNRRERWLRAINRAHVNEDGSVDQNKLWAPTSGHNYVCSAHFVSGKKVNDPCHPDFVPSVFPQNEDSAFSKSSKKVERYKRALKRHIAETESGGQKVTARKKLKLLDQQSPEYHKRTLSEHSYVKNLQVVIDEHSGEVNCDESCDYYPNSVSVQTDILPMRQPLEESEREKLYEEIANLRQERDEALARAASLEKLVSASTLNSNSVEGDDEACKMITGISWGVFLHLFNFLSTFMKHSAASTIPPKEQLFLTLIKLRHNLTFEFLAHAKGIPKSTTVGYFWKWMVSSVRIHIERVIGCMKNRFSILKGTLPVRCIKSLKNEKLDATYASCDKILTVCAALTNLEPSIVFQE